MVSVVVTRRNQPRPCTWQWTLYVAMVVSRVKRDGIKMYENALGVYTHDDCGHSLLVFHSRITNTVPRFTHVFLYCTSMRLTICRCCDGKLKQAVYLRQWQEKKLAATRACRSGSCEVRIFASFPCLDSRSAEQWDQQSLALSAALLMFTRRYVQHGCSFFFCLLICCVDI